MFACARVLLQSVCFERVPGRKSQWVGGILLRWHNCDMRSPRALVIRRECIVAVFKTWQLSASARATQWMQALESWLELSFGEQCEQHSSGGHLTAGCWVRIRGTLGAQWWHTLFLLGELNIYDLNNKALYYCFLYDNINLFNTYSQKNTTHKLFFVI